MAFSPELTVVGNVNVTCTTHPSRKYGPFAKPCMNQQVMGAGGGIQAANMCPCKYVLYVCRC